MDNEVLEFVVQADGAVPEIDAHEDVESAAFDFVELPAFPLALVQGCGDPR